MNYKDAIDLALKLTQEDKDGWFYVVEVEASEPNKAKIVVYDQDDIKLGYLGE
jgi:hypothetical protein